MSKETFVGTKYDDECIPVKAPHKSGTPWDGRKRRLVASGIEVKLLHQMPSNNRGPWHVVQPADHWTRWLDYGQGGHLGVGRGQCLTLLRLSKS